MSGVVTLQNAAAANTKLLQSSGGEVAAWQRFQNLSPAEQGPQLRVQGIRRQSKSLGKLRQGWHPTGCQDLQNALRSIAFLQNRQGREHRRVSALVAAWQRVQNHSAANGLQWREKADDKAIPASCGEGFRKAKLGIGALARMQHPTLQKDHSSKMCGGSVV